MPICVSKYKEELRIGGVMHNHNKNIVVKNIDDSLDFILTHRSSVARFGDGEMDIIAGRSIPYQHYDERLANELRHILSLESTPEFVVCVSDVFEKLDRYNEHCVHFWEGHKKEFEHLYQEVCTASWYGSTFISRPYIDLKDKSHSSRYFMKLKQLWDNQDILIVEGRTSRSGVGNDLFENARSIQRIICPSHHAFTKYDDIYEAITRYGQDKLILLMLGPTAKVLSYHLHQKGYRTIDIGHIDSEYEWFKMGATHKVKLHHKHTAEHNFDENIVFTEDLEYVQQIVYDMVDYPNKKRIDVVFSVNDRFAIHLGPTMLSFIEHHKTNVIHFHVLHAGISEKIISDLKIIETFSGVFVHFHLIEHTELTSISYVTQQFPIEAFFRIVAPEVLTNVDRALYLDVDILIKKSVTNLFELDMKNYEIGAVIDSGMYAFYGWHLSALDFSEQDNYFNSGVLLMNLKAMRHNQSSQTLLKMIALREYKFFDQDILNIFYKGNYLLLDSIYNYTDKCKLDKCVANEDVVIEHFNGDIKPWHAIYKIPEYIKTSVLNYQTYQQRYHGLFDREWVTIVICGTEKTEYIMDAINTALEQSYPYIKVIVVDVTETVLMGQVADERVRVIHGKKGISKTVVDVIDTPYVTFIQGDSWLDETYVEKLVLALQEEKSDISMTSFTELQHHLGAYVFREVQFEHTMLAVQETLERLSLYGTIEKQMLKSLFGKLYLTKHVKSCLTNTTLSQQELAYALLFSAKHIVVAQLQKYVVRSYENVVKTEENYIQELHDERFLNKMMFLLDYRLNDHVTEHRKLLKQLYQIATTNQFDVLYQGVVNDLNNL